MPMIHNAEHEPITVFLDYKGPEYHVRPFYCVRCGKCVCEVTGQATLVIPGKPDDQEVADFGITHIVKCTGVIYMGRDNRIKCTAKYSFN